jgi:hypothetical protein
MYELNTRVYIYIIGFKCVAMCAAVCGSAAECDFIFYEYDWWIEFTRNIILIAILLGGLIRILFYGALCFCWIRLSFFDVRDYLLDYPRGNSHFELKSGLLGSLNVWRVNRIVSRESCRVSRQVYVHKLSCSQATASSVCSYRCN